MAPIAPKQNRKRKTVDPPAPTQPLETLTGDLVLESDAEEELLEDGLARGGAAGEEEDDDENEPFPELDLGSSDEEEDGDFEVGGNEADSEEDDPAAAGDDEEDLSDDDSEGYNSSDIDVLSQSSTQPTSYTRSRTSRSKSPISNFIAENTTKPDERDPSIILRPEDPMAGKMVVSKLTGRPKRVYPDIEAGYGSESSTEDAPNRVGDIPDHWYDDLPHIGYDVNGKKVMRPAQGDELDKFLSTVEDPDSWTSVPDKLLQQNTNLTDAELDIIRRLQNAENPDENYDPYAPTVEWFTSHEEVMPLSNRPEPKARFVASKWEHKKVMKIVRAIRQGRIVPNKPAATKPQFYALWSNADAERAPHAMHMPAPAPRLPDDSESYNPPAEHLLDPEERQAWEETEKGDRKKDYMPQKFNSLRLVPAYKELVQERFERCLDLYLAPRMRRTKLNIDPESLVPKMPSPKELRPFPTMSAIKYEHPGGARVRCISVDPTGMWVVSGAEDGTVRVWELANGRLAWKVEVAKGPVFSVEWCPDRDVALVAVTVENKTLLIAPLPLLNPHVALHTTNTALKAVTGASTSAPTKPSDVTWQRGTEAERNRGILVVIDVPGTPKQITWHRKGDYFATVATDGANKAVLIHQLSKHQTQSPFKKTKGQVQKVAFHPSKPHFFVVTQRYIKLYDLVAQALIKTLQPGLKWLSSIDIHPMGDNLIVGSYDKKLCWFDLDLSSKPYKTLRYQTRAIRSVHYHRTYPLFASCSDDGTINVFHGTVYSDLMQNPLIVPLKVLRGHGVKNGLGVLDVKWHPTLPYLISAGADGEARLWAP